MASRKPRTGKYIDCLHCKQSIYIPKNRFGTAKYCSLKCKGLHELSPQIANCKTCGDEFTHISSRAKTAKYCSRKCYHKGQTGKGTVTYKCKHCLKDFLGSPSHKRIYCSMACVGKETKLTFKPSFTCVRKSMMRRNMITICNRCGYDEVPKILGVHHKDRDRKNNALSNLEVLCPNCHSLEHNKHIVT